MAQKTELIGSLLSEYFREHVVHRGARIVQQDPLTVETPEGSWHYAVSFLPQPAIADATGVVATSGRFVFDISVNRGAVGIGWTAPDGSTFLEERYLSGAHRRVALRIAAGQQVGRLIIRNASPSGSSSECVIWKVAFFPEEASPRYPVAAIARNVADEPLPPQSGIETFDTDAALAINVARLQWLESASLPVNGARVLDVGAGIGHFAGFYRSRGCSVVAIDGRPENIAELSVRHPDVQASVADAQELDPAAYGVFGVIHCFGLLYHLDSPVAALRRFEQMCHGILVLETMVCDSSRPVMVLADETKAASQAMHGLGCRPSPAFLAVALNRVGFNCVYGATQPPLHPDFQFTWRDDLSTSRDGVPLRCVVVASREPLDLPSLTPLLES
jgi:SAM-dependent methyltransferase